MDDRYDVEVVACNACAARERKAWNLEQTRDPESPPMFGARYIVTPEED